MTTSFIIMDKDFWSSGIFEKSGTGLEVLFAGRNIGGKTQNAIR
ncbi:MAG: hypothetical protein ACKVU2_01990 [Saprospiraceae bacterium]